MYDNIRHIDYVFVETLEGESEATWEGVIRDLLLLAQPNLSGLTPDRIPPFAAGPTVQYAGRRFRSMRTIAGSMHAFLIGAAERGRLPRAVILLASRGATAWMDGGKIQFNGREVESQLRPRAVRSRSVAKRIIKWVRGQHS